MERKTLIYGGMFVGSFVGGFIPMLWGDNNFLSFSSVLTTGVGGFLGIWIMYRLTR